MGPETGPEPQGKGGFMNLRNVHETLDFIGLFVASPGRFERPTPGLGIRCSIQLSYGDAKPQNQ